MTASPERGPYSLPSAPGKVLGARDHLGLTSLFCAFLSRGHQEPTCVDQEEFAKRAARVVHPGRQRVSPSPPFPEGSGRRKDA